MARELGTIVEYIDLLKDYDPSPPVPLAPSTGPATGWPVENLEDDDPWVMDDRPRACLPRELVMANAPAAVDGQLVVPAVLGLGGPAGPDEDRNEDETPDE